MFRQNCKVSSKHLSLFRLNNVLDVMAHLGFEPVNETFEALQASLPCAKIALASKTYSNFDSKMIFKVWFYLNSFRLKQRQVA